jgi:hypothetical protein
MWRAIALVILLAAIVNPSMVEEQLAAARRDVVVTNRRASASAIVSARPRATRWLRSGSARPERDLDLRVIRAGKPQPGAGDDGTRLFNGLDRAMSEVPRQRLAGVVMITDGQVHDAPSGDTNALRGAVGAPLHILLSGRPDEGDRRLIVNQAPSFGLVGKELKLTIRVEDLPQSSPKKEEAGPTNQARLTWRKDGGDPTSGHGADRPQSRCQ